MSALLGFFAQEHWRMLALSLLHSLWLGGAIWTVAALTLRLTPSRYVSFRYLTGITSLGLIVLSTFITFALLNHTGKGDARGLAMPASFAAKAHDSPATAEHSANVAKQPALGSYTFDSILSKSEESSVSSLNKNASEGWKDMWVPAVSLTWLIGLLLLLGNQVYSWFAARGIVRDARFLENEWTDTLHRLLRNSDFRMPSGLSVVFSKTINSPAVIGVVTPMIIVPLSLASGVAPSHIEAILLHEIAHIRRRDILVSHIQSLIEAVFFFNPFVWALSAQIRQEREACCDHWAAEQTSDSKLSYTEALLNCGRNALRFSPHMSGVAAASGGNLSDRVKRLLNPRFHRPSLEVPPRSAFVLTVISVFLIAGCAISTSHLTDSLLHSDALKKIQAARDDGSAKEVRFVGSVTDESGHPIEGVKVLFYASSHNLGGYGEREIETDADGAFDKSLMQNLRYVGVYHPGYDPYELGPLEFSRFSKKKQLDIILKNHDTATVRFVSEGGTPIVGGNAARDKIGRDSFYESGVDGTLGPLRTGPKPFKLSFQADGYEYWEATDMTLAPQEIREIVLKPTERITGLVLDANTGEPIPDASIRALKLFRADGTEFNQRFGSSLWKGNADGTFSVGTLPPGTQAYLLAEASGYETAIAASVQDPNRPWKFTKSSTPGDSGLIFRLKPHVLREVRIPFPEWFDHSDMKTADYRTETYWESDAWDQDFYEGMGRKHWVKQGEIATQMVSRPAPVCVSLTHKGDLIAKYEVTGLNSQSEPIVLTEKSIDERRLILRIPEQSDALTSKITGSIPLRYDGDNGRPLYVNIEGGQGAHFIDKDAYEIKWAYVPGYWIPSQIVIIPEGPSDVPFVYVIQGAVRSGAIKTTYNLGNTTTGEYRVGYTMTKTPPGLDSEFPPSVALLGDIESGNKGGGVHSYQSEPLPYGGRYFTYASVEKRFGLSDLITISPSNPFEEVHIKIPEATVSFTGSVHDWEGKPVPATVRLQVAPEADIQSVQIAYSQMDESDGSFSFEDIGYDKRHHYTISVTSPGHQSQVLEIEPDELLKVQLEKGFE